MTNFVWPNADTLRPLFPHAKRDIIVPFADALPTGGDELGSVLRLAHFIGQCGVETAYFDTYQEYASGSEYEGAARLGNTHPGDGRRYKGRGPIQLTGRANYRKATPYVRQLLGRPTLDLEANPEIVETDRAVGFATSLWYWTTNHLNRWADRNDASAVSRGVNRGDPENKYAANAERERISLTNRLIPMLQGIQVPSAAGQPPQEPTSTAPRLLRPGDRGAAVRALQAALNANGSLQLIVDGDYGDATKAAVRAFQKASGLKQDGIAGPVTLEALKLLN